MIINQVLWFRGTANLTENTKKTTKHQKITINYQRQIITLLVIVFSNKNWVKWFKNVVKNFCKWWESGEVSPLTVIPLLSCKPNWKYFKAFNLANQIIFLCLLLWGFTIIESNLIERAPNNWLYFICYIFKHSFDNIITCYFSDFFCCFVEASNKKQQNTFIICRSFLKFCDKK